MARNLIVHKHKPIPVRNTFANPDLKPFSIPDPGTFPDLYPHVRYLNGVPDLKPVHNTIFVPDTYHIVLEPVLKPVSVPNPYPDPDLNPVPDSNPIPNLNPVPDTNPTMDTVLMLTINSDIKPVSPEDSAIQSFVDFPEVIIESLEPVEPVPRRTSWWSCCGLCDFWRKK